MRVAWLLSFFSSQIGKSKDFLHLPEPPAAPENEFQSFRMNALLAEDRHFFPCFSVLFFCFLVVIRMVTSQINDLNSNLIFGLSSGEI